MRAMGQSTPMGKLRRTKASTIFSMSCAALRLSGGVPDRFASLQGLKAMPAERDGHSLSGQAHVSSAICFAEGMTAYLYAHKVRIFATTRFSPSPTAIDCGKTRNRHGTL